MMWSADPDRVAMPDHEREDAAVEVGVLTNMVTGIGEGGWQWVDTRV